MKVQSKERLPYIDIAKGILILFLLYGHSTLFTRRMGYEDESMILWNRFIPWYNSFFMPAFFIITGFCSSYKGKFLDYLSKSVKTLLLPAVVIVTANRYLNDLLLQNEITVSHLTDLSGWLVDKGPWFIFALFWSKLLYWVLYRFPLKYQVAVIAFIYLLGFVAVRFIPIPNIQSYQHAMLLLPFLAFGAFLKEHRDLLDRYLKPIALFGAVSITLQWILSLLGGVSLPSLDANINVSIRTFPIHIVNSISGTAFIIYLSQLLGNNSFLQTIGKGTLLLYLGNGIFQTIGTMIAYAVIPNNSYIWCLVIHVIAFILCVVIGFLAVKIVYRNRCLMWIVGKW